MALSALLLLLTVVGYIAIAPLFMMLIVNYVLPLSTAVGNALTSFVMGTLLRRPAAAQANTVQFNAVSFGKKFGAGLGLTVVSTVVAVVLYMLFPTAMAFNWTVGAFIANFVGIVAVGKAFPATLRVDGYAAAAWGAVGISVFNAILSAALLLATGFLWASVS